MSNAADEIQPAVFSPFKVVDFATEADFEYTSALGGSAAANNDILSIMNQVQGIFERDIGLTFSITFQHTWDTANDPYSASGDAAAVLREFTNYWNANFAGNRGDVAHLWTGRDLGGSAGVAWTGVVCRSPLNSYGVSTRETLRCFVSAFPPMRSDTTSARVTATARQVAITQSWPQRRVSQARFRFVSSQSAKLPTRNC